MGRCHPLPERRDLTRLLGIMDEGNHVYLVVCREELQEMKSADAVSAIGGVWQPMGKEQDAQ